MNFAVYLFTSVFSSAVLSAALFWLFKSWISERLKNAIAHEYSEKLESHKALLKASSDVEMERLRSQLSKATTEHQIKFSGLHARRADVIAETYNLLVLAHWDGSSFASPIQFPGEPSKELKYSASMQSLADFHRYFDRHRLYLPPAICAKIDPLIEEMRKRVHMYGVYLDVNDAVVNADTRRDKMDAWNELWKYFKDELPVARAALEAELRAILGDDLTHSP